MQTQRYDDGRRVIPKIHFEMLMTHEIDKHQGLELPWKTDSLWAIPSNLCWYLCQINISFRSFSDRLKQWACVKGLLHTSMLPYLKVSIRKELDSSIA